MASRRRASRALAKVAQLDIGSFVFRSTWTGLSPVCEHWCLYAEPPGKDGIQPIEAGGTIFRPVLAATAFGMPPNALYGELAKLPDLFRTIYERVDPDAALLEGYPKGLLEVALRREMLERAGIADLFQEVVVPDQHIHVSHVAFRDGYATEENLALMIDSLVERFQASGAAYGRLMTVDAAGIMDGSFVTDDGPARAAWVMSELGFVRFGDLLVHRTDDECAVVDGLRRQRFAVAPLSGKRTPL